MVRKPLTPRETEVARLIARGLQDKQIARELGIALSTVKYYVRRILLKWDCGDRHEVARLFDARD